MFKTITSTQNEIVKSVVALHEAKNRTREKKFIAEGLRTISTLVTSATAFDVLFTTQAHIEDAQKIAPSTKIVVVSDQVIKKMSQATSPSGLLAVFEMPAQPSPDQLTAGLVLAQMTDPGNMGTMLRTCVAMNVKTVVVVEGVDPYNFKCVQASAGTVAQLTIFQLDWHELLEHKKHLKLYALVVKGGAPIKTIHADHALLVLGNEAHGLPQQWIADCDAQITIAMPGNAESLNAAVAGSIALYEVFGK